jgi:hypothetical protein
VESRRRAVDGAAVLLFGVAFCFVMYWWQLRYRYAAHDVGLALFASIPFLGLAALVALGGMRRVAAIVGWLVLAGLVGIAYVASATSSSSTAVVVWIAPYLYGGFALLILFVGDTFLRAWKTWRNGKRASSAPPQR